MDNYKLRTEVTNQLGSLKACEDLRGINYCIEQIDEKFKNYHQLNPNDGDLMAEFERQTRETMSQLISSHFASGLAQLSKQHSQQVKSNIDQTKQNPKNQ